MQTWQKYVIPKIKNVCSSLEDDPEYRVYL